jgi:hypothetical protein
VTIGDVAMDERSALAVHNSGPVKIREERLAGRYVVLGELDRGGNAVTYEAEDTQTGKRVALKKLDLRALEEWKGLELFEREAAVLAQLEHPAIPRYIANHQIDTPEGPAFLIAQELAPGKSLEEWLAGGWKPTEADVSDVATQVLSVLDYLHARTPPVFHRDLKPQNLVRDDKGRIAVVDFGAVRAAANATMRGGSTVAGTFGYMAPEQLRGQASAASDLYGLGATLVHLLAGRSPDRLPQTRLRFDLSGLPVSPPLRRWLERLLEPEPEERFASAGQALAALRNPRAGRRRRARSWVFLALLAITVAGAGGLIYLRMEQAQEKAMQAEQLAEQAALRAREEAQPHGENLEPPTPSGPQTSFAAHQGAVTALAIDSKGDLLVSAGLDGVRTWRNEDLLTLGYTPGWGQGPLPSMGEGAPLVAVRDDGGLVVEAAGSWVQGWDGNGKSLWQKGLDSGVLTSVAIAPGGANMSPEITTVDDQGVVTHLSPATGWPIGGAAGTPKENHRVDNGLAYSQNGQLLVSTADDTLMIENVIRPDVLYGVLQQKDYSLGRVAFGQDPDRPVTLSADGTIRVWSIEKSAVLHTDEAPTSQTALAVSGSRIATAGADGIIYLWDLNKGTWLGTIHNPDGPVTALVFDGSGKDVVAGSADGRINVLPIPPPETGAAPSPSPSEGEADSPDKLVPPTF